MKAGADIQTIMSAAYWLAPYGLLSLSYSTQDHQRRDDNAHSQLGPPTSSIS